MSHLIIFGHKPRIKSKVRRFKVKVRTDRQTDKTDCNVFLAVATTLLEFLKVLFSFVLSFVLCLVQSCLLLAHFTSLVYSSVR